MVTGIYCSHVRMLVTWTYWMHVHMLVTGIYCKHVMLVYLDDRKPLSLRIVLLVTAMYWTHTFNPSSRVKGAPS